MTVRDDRLPWLPQALDCRIVTNNVREALPGLRVESAQLFRHKPGKRALIDYTVFSQLTGRRTHWIGKCRHKGCDHRTRRLHDQLNAYLAENPSQQLAIPKAIASIEALGLWIQQRVDGVDGWSVMTDASLQVARRTGLALAELQAVPITTDKTHAIADELAILDTRLDLVAEEEHASRSQLQSLREALHGVATQLTDRPQQLIHRDFYPDQILLGQQRTWLLDLDLACLGDPALDAGNYLAHLDEYALRRGLSPARIERIAEAFLQGWLPSSPQRQSSDRHAVAVYRVLSLARHISIARQFPERRPYWQAIWHQTEAMLARLTTETAHRCGVHST